MVREVFISVDVETSGPIPGEYSLLSLGACRVDDLEGGFYVEFKPISTRAVPKALEVSGFSLEVLEREGLDPEQAMRAFRDWLTLQVGDGQPVFVGLNAAFDWSFVNDYFHRHLGDNPFGFAPLDLKSLYMGCFHSSWQDTRSSRMHAHLKLENTATHHALDDARAQARVFLAIRGA